MDRKPQGRRSQRHRKMALQPRKATRGGARKPALPRQLMVLGLILAFLAIFLLIRYQVQAHRLRQEQEQQRALFRQQTSKEPEAAPAPTEQAAAQAAAQAEQTSAQGAENQNAQQVPQQPADSLPAYQMQPERQAADDRFLPLLRRNSDTVGWLSYPLFPEMDYVVVQRDNEHYMTRSFTGEKNAAGTVFLDQSNAIRPQDQNMILHGHNMKNGTMFGRLNRLLEPSMMKLGPFVSFDTLYQDTKYVPYALAILSVNPDSPQYFEVIRPNFHSMEEISAYVNGLRQRSALFFPTEVAGSDRLLTLITCHGNEEDERLVLALRALRPGEDEQTLANQLAQGLSKR